jgi:hypothetical protein
MHDLILELLAKLFVLPVGDRAFGFSDKLSLSLRLKCPEGV